MEGVGSRLGRASSRYGPATVFNGPVRKWKKQWVPFSSSYHNSFRSNNNNNNSVSNGGNNTSPLLLCRWTPISTSDSVEPGHRPRRKLRYTPIVVLEDQKKEAAEKVDDNAKTKAHPLTTATMSKNDDAREKPNTKNAFMEEFQAEVENNQLAQQSSNASHLNLDLGLKGDEENHESGDENEVVQLGRVSSGEFGAIA